MTKRLARKISIFKREYSIGEILSRSWSLFKENFRLILFVVLIVYIPMNIILSFVPIETLYENFGFFRGLRVYMKIVQIFEFLIGIIATMAIAFIIKSRLDKKKVDIKTALKKSILKWPAAIGTSLLGGIFLLGLFLLLIVPGIIYKVYWMFFLYAVILHNKTGKSALNYSKAIVKGRWWKVFGYSIIFYLFAIILGIILGIPAYFLPSNVFLDVSYDTFLYVVGSFFTVVSIVFFINFDSTKIQRANIK